MDVGDDSVVIGNVPPGQRVGNRSVVIGATDEHGNTILRGTMAVGHGAQAGPDSIAIGSGAGAGTGIQVYLARVEAALDEIAVAETNKAVLTALNAFRAEISKPEPKKSLVARAFETMRNISAVNGTHTLGSKLQDLAPHVEAIVNGLPV